MSCLKAFSGSSPLTAVPWHSPALTEMAVYVVSFCACRCHFKKCNGSDEVSLITLVKHPCPIFTSMFLIISDNDPKNARSSEGCLDRFLCVWNDEWWNLPFTIAAWGPAFVMYSLMVSDCFSMSHGESCKALSLWGRRRGWWGVVENYYLSLDSWRSGVRFWKSELETQVSSLDACKMMLTFSVSIFLLHYFYSSHVIHHFPPPFVLVSSHVDNLYYPPPGRPS